MTVQVGTSGYKWFYVVKSGLMWLSCFMWLSGFMWRNGCMWIKVVLCGHVAKWFYVAKSDEKWIKVAISCG